MKSGLEGRNNSSGTASATTCLAVSMKSGLEGRNNPGISARSRASVRVSMKSGLEGRNNVNDSVLVVVHGVVSQ